MRPWPGALGAALALPLIGAAQAQDDFPSGPIEIINMSSPGGGTDIFLRTLAICAQEELGTDIVVLSKTGGLGAAMVNYAANRERDGHTLLAINPGSYVTVSKGGTPVETDELVALVRGTEDPQFLIAKADSPLADARPSSRWRASVRSRWAARMWAARTGSPACCLPSGASSSRRSTCRLAAAPTS